MAEGAPQRHCCSFCGRSISEMADDELLHVSHIGGLPPAICSSCVQTYREYDDLHAKAPDLVAVLTAMHNDRVAKERGMR